ncbi:MAG: NeuD/PglB/VioB family sugar acetyltransferase [Actinobacteria bacterium]|nr:NeuD/PglB/VioB family sugar acetyltransferase [Actinomycetota bacterium]
MTVPLLLVAAGGLAREVLSVCAAIGRPVQGVLDDDPVKAGAEVGGTRVLGPIDHVERYPDTELLLCAGKGSVRRDLAVRLEGLGVTDDRYGTVVDESVHVPSTCRVGQGTILLRGVVLTTDVRVGRHVVCMPHVTLTHDDDLADFVTLTAGVSLGGGVVVGEAAYIGMNASVREGRTVGAGSVLGMGAALVTDQPPGTTYAGVPARPIKE